MSTRPGSGARSLAPLTFALVAGACLAAIAALGALTFWNVYAKPAQVVRPNLTVGDVPVGGMARDEVRQIVQSRLASYVETPVDVTTPDGPRRFTAGELGYRPELAATLAELEAVGVPLERETLLAEWTGGARPRSVAPAFSVDDGRLEPAIVKLAAAFDRPPVDAQLKVAGDTSIDLIPARAGVRVDRAELRRRVQATFRGMATSLALPTEIVPPGISDEDLRPLRAAAEQFIAKPLEVRAGALSWTLSRGDLASWVIFRKDDATGKPVLDLHPERPRNWLIDRAGEVNRPAHDARLTIVVGKVQAAQPESPGLELDRAGALAALKGAMTRPDRVVELPVKTTMPAVTTAQASTFAFPDLLAEASTIYAGGLPERSHNVELAASRVDGLVVPAGGTFSFNAAIGRTRLKDGYQMAFGIQSGGDGVQTVPSVAGGICQVATTLFHAAFWTGLPILERHEHPYWIPKYGLPPRGMTGLDTTVDEDSRLDFQFRNTTAGPLLVRTTTDGGKVTFQLLGQKPDWHVSATQPVLSSFVKTDPTFQRQEDPTLEAGRAIQVEEARDGFDALVVRTVTKGGTVLDKLEVKSHYAPSHNVVLVGTRKAGG